MADPAPAPESTRDRILDAAVMLMRSIGLARVTTRKIAQNAGFSEAALYRHFQSKEEIFIAVLMERMPPLNPLLLNLIAGADDRSVEDCLTEVARQAALLYESTLPIGVSIFAEPSLLQRHREALQALNAGPQKPIEALTVYLRMEQTRGRIRADADPRAAAQLLFGACFQRAFLMRFVGPDYPGPPVDDFARTIARTVMAGIG